MPKRVESPEPVFPVTEIDERPSWPLKKRQRRVIVYTDPEALVERLEQFDTRTYIKDSDSRTFLDSLGRRVSFEVSQMESAVPLRLELEAVVPRPEDLVLLSSVK